MTHAHPKVKTRFPSPRLGVPFNQQFQQPGNIGPILPPAHFGKLPTGSQKGEGGGVHQRAGEFGDDLNPALLAVFLFEDVLLPGGDESEALGRCAGRPLGPREAAHHVASDAVLLQHHGDGLLGVVARIALASALGVVGEGLFELIGEAEVIDHESAGLVAEDAVNAGDGLHEAVAFN
jgi:hypothetical protein